MKQVIAINSFLFHCYIKNTINFLYLLLKEKKQCKKNIDKNI